MARRRMGKVDKLKPDLKDVVEQMLLTGASYKDIVAFLKENGEEMSQMAISTYAKKYMATVEMLNVAQTNFNSLMDEMKKYPDIDTSEALIRLSGHHVLNALTGMNEEDFKKLPPDKLIRQSTSLIRAATYKKRVQIQNQEEIENAFDATKAVVFELMKKEKPELYEEVRKFLDSKKEEGAIE